MGNSGVSPKVIWESDKCFLMEMVNGPILQKYENKNYTEKDVNDLSKIAHALADAQIAYADGNVKMNVLYDLNKKQWMLIDFGMVYTDSKMKKSAKTHKLSLKQEYLLNAFKIMLNVELILMQRKYGSAKFMYTPLGGGFLPKSSFPTLLHEMNKLGLLEYADRFNLYKKARESRGKHYDTTKMIGV